MKFLYPLGLLGLLCIPVLILIYILKNKYVEKIVSSTYIWNLSEKFLKKKKPLKKITDLISLILQVIIVLILSISIAHPVFTIPNSAENVCFVLDISGSMNINNGSITRFEKGKQKIVELVNSSSNGSTFTLITASKETKVILEKEENKEKVLNKLNEISLDYSSSSLIDALTTIQNYYNEQKIGHTYLITDKTYSSVSNIDLINVSSQEENYALYDSKYQIRKGKINIGGNLISYESDSVLNINLYLDDKFIVSQEVNVNKMVEKQYSFSIDEQEFSSMKVEITNSDALSLDNINILYSVGSKNVCSTLIVTGNSTFYVSSILKAIGNVKIEEISPSSYHNQQGYDLYIFDSYSPNVLPNDGTIWLINTSKNIASSGFVVQNSVSLKDGGKTIYEQEKSSLYNELTKNTKNNSVSINQYMKYGLYREFTTILSINKIPLIFAGNNDYGNREVVFSFDFQNTDFPLLYDYIVLMRNFLNYSNPSPLENLFYKVGEDINVNIVNDCSSVKVISPSNNISYLETNFSQTSFSLDEVGTYQFDFLINNEIKTYKIYVEFDSEEGKIFDNQTSIDLINNSNNLKFDGILDNLFIVILLAAILFSIDWMWYSYEQR